MPMIINVTLKLKQKQTKSCDMGLTQLRCRRGNLPTPQAMFSNLLNFNKFFLRFHCLYSTSIFVFYKCFMILQSYDMSFKWSTFVWYGIVW